jgi:acyl-[acyl-carrier-protein]-phospholipid O-acyltransferase/long-chain-fatty-acid--[acyl-carrier-protein] ligase
MRGFWSLIVTQFQGAFSDLTYRTLLLFLIVGLERSPEQQKFLVFLVGLVFSLPFVLFSMTGGWLADRFSKRSVTIGTKVMEVAVMALALVALTRGHWPLAITALFLMATQSALFGPSKYGLLPELLPEKKLSWGNGVIELATFLAIIGGTVAGGILAENLRGEQHWSGVLLVALAFVGLLTSLGIARVPAAAPAKRSANFLADLIGQVRLIRADYVLFLACSATPTSGSSARCCSSTPSSTAPKCWG